MKIELDYKEINFILKNLGFTIGFFNGMCGYSSDATKQSIDRLTLISDLVMNKIDEIEC